MQVALCEKVKDGGVVYHGNAGHLLLPGVAHVLCARLIAPMDFRVRMLRERMGLEEEDAVEYIETVDHQREAWTRFLYGVDWLDPHLFDICINLRTLDLSDAVELVATSARAPRFQPTAESRTALTNLLLASKVKAALAANSRTSGAEVEVRADGGVVHLRGRLRPASLVDAVLEVAGTVEGVTEIDRSNLAAPDYTV